jgi:hypothetical protein
VTTREKTSRLSVTINPELKASADEIARNRGITTSRLVSECLEEIVRRRKEELMKEFYLTNYDEHRDFAEKTLPLVQETVASWSNENDAKTD